MAMHPIPICDGWWVLVEQSKSGHFDAQFVWVETWGPTHTPEMMYRAQNSMGFIRVVPDLGWWWQLPLTEMATAQMGESGTDLQPFGLWSLKPTKSNATTLPQGGKENA